MPRRHFLPMYRNRFCIAISTSIAISIAITIAIAISITISIDSMSHPEDTARTDDIKEKLGATSEEYNGLSEKQQAGGRLSATILPHLLNMYNSRSSATDYEIYAPDATFEDPLMCAHGIKQIKSAFYSIPKVFSESRMGEYTIHEVETSPGNGEINIDNIQYYKILGRQIDMISLINLQVKDGKVIRHEDRWDKKPLWNRQTGKLPLAGQAVEKIRRGNMLLTHLLMGFGKDPLPKKT